MPYILLLLLGLGLTRFTLSNTGRYFQVRGLTEAAKNYETLNSILDLDLRNDTVRTQGSLSRNLRRVRQGLDLIRSLFVNFLSPEYVFLLYSTSLFISI